jgi:hypothetical protein
MKAHDRPMNHTRVFPPRRGLLLLIVVLMLSLFMAAGAMLLTIAARARAAARAMDVANRLGVADMVARDALDAALLAALRGATSGANGSVTVTGTLENLLADKYGSPITATGTSLSGTATPVMSFTLNGLPGDAERRLAGRIATIVPRTGDGDIASYRILAVTQSAGINTCSVAQLPHGPQRSLPAQTFDVFINGREFTPVAGTTTPEAYDAYDAANLWLAQPVIDNGQVKEFGRLSFVGSGSTATVDNDNDGVLDGVWLSNVVPDQPSPLGGMLRCEVSYLILDLDGRINVNTSGVAMQQGSYAGTPNTPLGMGYGPADVNAQLVLPPTLPTVSGTYAFTNVWRQLLLSGTPDTTPSSPTSAQRRAPPLVGPIDGRYGSGGLPGVSGDDSVGNQQTTAGVAATGFTDSLYGLTLAGNNAVADLKAQTRVYMTSPTAAQIAQGQVTPTLNFYRPTWVGSAGADAVDDPYEARLDTDAPRWSVQRRPAVGATGNDDNPFTLAELERVLRPNDPDATHLPQRLAAGLEGVAQRSRMTITTDSWSTPGLTGLAARALEDYMAASIPFANAATWTGGSNVMSPDIAAGLRFNINRPVETAAQKQEFCKGLYTLVMALGATDANQAAQWAVNVLDFRDADSIMTAFSYDTNLADGWSVTSSPPVVYGAERPDVVIVETAAWRRPGVGFTPSTAQLFVTLHRPATQALLWDGSGGSPTVSGTVETSPFATSGTLSLAGWQLRLSSGTAARLDRGTASAATGTPQFRLVGTAVTSATTVVLSSPTATPPTGLATSGTGSYLCVSSTNTREYLATGIPTLQISSTSSAGFRLWTGAAPASSGTVSLERLADPSQANSASNPYIVVDTAVVASVPDLSVTPPPRPKNRRAGPSDASTTDSLARFWRQPSPWISQSGTTMGVYPAVSGTNPVAWFHWPNRPFISQAELAMVPTGTTSTDGILASYSFPINSLASSTNQIIVNSSTTTLGALILDATFVPSRFAGNTVSIPGTSINSFGLDKLGANHFSKWREPGRVNVNTVAPASNPGSPTSPSLDEAVWNTLLGNTYVINPFIPRSKTIPAVPAQPATSDRPAIPAIPAIPSTDSGVPADSLAEMLSLSGASGQPIVTGTFTTVSGAVIFPRDKNPFFSYAQAIRLANTATVQSNVFAVWITVRITDDSPNAPSPVTRRLFAIVDRSIPVGYSPNLDLNVRETIRLKRYLD